MSYQIDEMQFDKVKTELLHEIQIHESQKNQKIRFDNGYFKKDESYKYIVNQNGRIALQLSNCEVWNEDTIGTGLIFNCVQEALKQSSNLVHYMSKTNFQKAVIKDIFHAEQLLYDLYQRNDECDQVALNGLVKNFAAGYDLIAYLFFLKNDYSNTEAIEKYLPIKPSYFKERFKKLNIKTTCCSGCTWEHYQEYIKIMRDIQNRLMHDFGQIRLLDAHSFVWSMHLLYRDYADGIDILTEGEWIDFINRKDIFTDEACTLIAAFYTRNEKGMTYKKLGKQAKREEGACENEIEELGKRIAVDKGIARVMVENKLCYWPILFYARKIKSGTYEFQLRPELYRAMTSPYNRMDSFLEHSYKDLGNNELRERAVNESNGNPEKGKVTTTRYNRSKSVSLLAKRLANGICMLCKNPAPFLDRYNSPYLETHHLDALSDEGADTIENVAALCPNCHRKMHAYYNTDAEIADRLMLKELMNQLNEADIANGSK